MVAITVLAVLSLSLLPNNGHCYTCIENRRDGYGTHSRHCDPSSEYSQEILLNECKCHYIHINGTGDGDCQSLFLGKKWCYVVGAVSGCKDKEKSAHSDEVFYNAKEVFYSEEACANHDETEVAIIGNEEFLPGIELTTPDASPEFGGGGLEAPTPEACETECYVREDFCAAWTYIPSESEIENGTCHLKAFGDICNNQLAYREVNALAISGFRCYAPTTYPFACWSTTSSHHEGCPMQEFASSGVETPNLSATAAVGITRRPGRYRRQRFAFINGRWIPIKNGKPKGIEGNGNNVIANSKSIAFPT